MNVENGEMRDFTAGHITSEEGRPLVEAVGAALGGPVAGGRLEFHPGVSYRNILVFRADKSAPFAADTKTQPPHDIPDKPIADHLPQGPGSELLRDLMERSRAVLADHPVNKARIAKGKRPATQIWLWGQGRAPTLQPFAEKYGKRGAILSAVDLVRGVGVLLGWKRIDVPGATGYLDTDYAAKGRYAVAALPDYDLVCVHVEAPDEASHEGKADEKVKALERIDRARRRPAPLPSPSRPKQSRLHLPAAERDHPPESVAHLPAGIDAQRVQQARPQVLRSDRLVGRVGGQAIRTADDLAPRPAAARHHQRITLRPVVAARRIDAVAGELSETRRPAELAHADHQRRIEQAARARSSRNAEKHWSNSGSSSSRRRRLLLKCVSQCGSGLFTRPPQ